ncbi:MAG: dockerin type I domain-containing protein [bacterium]
MRTINSTSHWGDVIVTDNAKLNVVGCTLVVHGNVEFDWHSAINFVDATIRMVQDYSFQHFLEGSNWATLRMTRSTVAGSGWQLHWYLNNESSLIVEEGSIIRYSEEGANIFAWDTTSIVVTESVLEEMVIGDWATVSVSNSTVGFELAFGEGAHVELVDLRDSQGGGDWSITPAQGSGFGFSLIMTNSAWHNHSVSFPFDANTNVEITFTDCHTYPGLQFSGQTEITIDLPTGSGLVDTLVYGTSRLVLNNSQVDHWWVYTYESSSVHINGMAVAEIFTFDESQVWVSNSPDLGERFQAANNSQISVFNSTFNPITLVETFDSACIKLINSPINNFSVEDASRVYLAWITSPQDSQEVANTVPIMGTASMEVGPESPINFSNYTTAYAPAEDTTLWTSIGMIHTAPIVEDLLETWDTANLGSGDYVLRLTVTDSEGATVSARRVVSIKGEEIVINLTSEWTWDDQNPAWSPDGTKIIYSTKKNGVSLNIWVMDSDGSDKEALTDNTNDNVNMPGSSWCPANDRICFSSDIIDNDEIWTMGSDGTDLQRVTDGPARDWEPTWSPDGEWIVFQSDRSGNWDIYKIRPDGTDLVPLTSHPADDWEPNWSPVGGRIVFQSQRTGDWDVWTMDTSGSELVNITDDPAEDTDPSWSPDGQTIVYSSNYGGHEEPEIWTIPAGGQGMPKRITYHPAYDGAPSFSPDGTQIAFESERSGNLDIWVTIIKLKGDVNDDGVINVLDVVLTVNIILGLHEPTPEEECAADYNEDGQVNVLDVVMIVNEILGSGF